MIKISTKPTQSKSHLKGRHSDRRVNVFRKLLGFAVALIAATLPGVIQAQEQKVGVRNIVLVHGAFTDGSSWKEVISLLQAKGYQVTAVQNPLTSLADDVAATKRVLERQNGGVLLVGHSWAGAVITEAGSTENVKGLVYLSALVPDAGESVGDMLKKRHAPMEMLAPDANGLIWLDNVGAFAHVMAADLSPQRVAVLTTVQQPIAAKAFDEKLETAAWADKPSWYLVTEGDNALPTPVQLWLAHHIGARTKSIRSSHMSMISHADVVADFIISAAQQLDL